MTAIHDGRTSERIKEVLKRVSLSRGLAKEELLRPWNGAIKLSRFRPQTHTIRQAMEQLEKTEEKIVFVVDGESRLLGSLTDGDIRRWILSDGDLKKARVDGVCNRKPCVAEEGYDAGQVRSDMLRATWAVSP